MLKICVETTIATLYNTIRIQLINAERVPCWFFPTKPAIIPSVLPCISIFMCWHYVTSNLMQRRPENALDPVWIVPLFLRPFSLFQFRINLGNYWYLVGCLRYGSPYLKVSTDTGRHTHTQTHTFMSRAGFEPIFPVFEQLKTEATGHCSRPRYLPWLVFRKINRFCDKLIWNIHKGNTFLELLRAILATDTV